MNEPLKHHFTPAFYLRQWAGDDGQLCEFSKPYGNVVKPKRTHPESTGYVERLYSVEGLPDAVAHVVESRFMQPLDESGVKGARKDSGRRPDSVGR